METAERYTSGEVAQILAIPAPTLRSWHQLGYLDFVRPVGDDLAPGRWSRFSSSEIQEIAVMLELTKSGVSPKLASRIVERSRATIFGVCGPYLCVARSGELYTFTHGRSLASLALPNNWYHKGTWRGEWMTGDGEPAVNASKPAVPANLILVDAGHVRETVLAAIKTYTAE